MPPSDAWPGYAGPCRHRKADAQNRSTGLLATHGACHRGAMFTTRMFDPTLNSPPPPGLSGWGDVSVARCWWCQGTWTLANGGGLQGTSPHAGKLHSGGADGRPGVSGAECTSRRTRRKQAPPWRALYGRRSTLSHLVQQLRLPRLSHRRFLELRHDTGSPSDPRRTRSARLCVLPRAAVDDPARSAPSSMYISIFTERKISFERRTFRAEK